MAIIVRYDEHGNPEYRSAKGVGSSEEERAKARDLDHLLKNELDKLGRKLSKKHGKGKKPKADVLAYWQLGHLLREIYDKSGLINESDKYLYWSNARLHLPILLAAKDRGPNRQHLEYCFRVAGFLKEKAIRMKWGEWVFIFDSPGINKEPRFDKWLEKKMETNIDDMKRENIRIMVQCINSLIGKVETRDLTNEQLARCYDTAWAITKKMIKKDLKMADSKNRDALKLALNTYYSRFGEVVKGDSGPDEFSSLIVQDINAE